MSICYRAEFLFFNDYIRSQQPKLVDSGVWLWDKSKLLVLFIEFDTVLRTMRVLDKKDPLLASRRLSQELIPSIKRDVDVAQWLNFVKSIGFEEMLTKYSKVIFGCFGSPFEIPEIIIHPVRLRPLEPNLYNRLLSRTYSFRDIIKADIPHYDIWSQKIFIPTPEIKMVFPKHEYDRILIHEIFHAPLRILYGFYYRDEDSQSFEVPEKEEMTLFIQAFCEAGAWHVLKKFKLFKDDELEGKYSFGSFYNVAITAIEVLGFEKICNILRPALDLYKNYLFLIKERDKIDRFTTKQLRGVLIKKYIYSTKVKGMDKKKLKTEVRKRFHSRMKALKDQIERMDVKSLLRQGIDAEKDVHKKPFWAFLLALFDKEIKVWKNPEYEFNEFLKQAVNKIRQGNCKI